MAALTSWNSVRAANAARASNSWPECPFERATGRTKPIAGSVVSEEKAIANVSV
jgi:hypothetical protein